MALYNIPSRYFSQFGVVSNQGILRAVVLRTPGNDVKYRKTHATPAPEIRQRLVVIDGFLSASENRPFQIRDDVIGQPIPSGRENSVPIANGYVTFLPLQDAGGNLWRSTNKVEDEPPPTIVRGRPAFRPVSHRILKYEDAPEGYRSRHRIDILLEIEGVEEVLEADVSALGLEPATP